MKFPRILTGRLCSWAPGGLIDPDIMDIHPLVPKHLVTAANILIQQLGIWPEESRYRDDP
jgi:hypothetical protein